MLVRYYMAAETNVLHDESLEARKSYLRRAETITTLTGALILLAMLSLLLVAHG